MAEVICAICQAVTSKGKTYSIGDGKRACRTHEGVTEKKDQLQQQEKDKREFEERAKEEARARKQAEYENNKPVLAPHCWKCKAIGIKKKDFFQILVISNKKAEIKTGQGMLSRESLKQFQQDLLPIKRKMGLADEFELAVLEILELEKNLHILPLLNRDGKMIASLTKLICLCDRCCDKHKAVRYEPPLLANMKAQDMLVFGALMDEPLRELAQKEIDEEAKRN
jgi:hypothetical protein